MPEHPLYVYITVGDYQWETSGFPMDSAASIEALFEWMAKTYGVKRVYWRGEQDRIWLQNYAYRRENPLYCNIWGWLRHLNENVKTNDLALAAADRYGMEIYAVEGLFEHAAQGDTGGVGCFPYPNEDRLRIEHPEWLPVDRWGERLAPGPIEFCMAMAARGWMQRGAGGWSATPSLPSHHREGSGWRPCGCRNRTNGWPGRPIKWCMCRSAGTNASCAESRKQWRSTGSAHHLSRDGDSSLTWEVSVAGTCRLRSGSVGALA